MKDYHLQHDSETFDTALADTFIMCVAKWYCLFYGVAFYLRPCMRKNRRGIYYAYHIFDEIKELSPLLHEYVMDSLQASTHNSIPAYVFTKINWLCSIVAKEGSHTEIILAHVFLATFIEMFEARLEPGEEMMNPIDCELHQHIDKDPLPEYDSVRGIINYSGFFSTAITHLMHDNVISKEARLEVINTVGDPDIVSILIEELEPRFNDGEIDERVLTPEEIRRCEKLYSESKKDG